MAAWLDKLKNLVDINIDLSNFSFITFHIGTINRAKNGGSVNTQNSPFHLDEKKQILQIDPTKLSPEKFQELSDIITEEYIPEGNYLLESDSFEVLDRLYQFNKKSSYRKYVRFFKDIIPHEDHRALESSYFLRQEMDVGTNSAIITQYKTDIRSEFGQRGGHIANLCTAGYFEEMLYPAYNHDPEFFKYMYNLLVDERALTIFIHAWMKKPELVSTLKNKLERAKKYGLPYFYIHARGKRNIKTVKGCIAKYEEDNAAVAKIEKNIEELGIIVIQIILS